jgi:hypothetical protein
MKLSGRLQILLTRDINSTNDIAADVNFSCHAKNFGLGIGDYGFHQKRSGIEIRNPKLFFKACLSVSDKPGHY